MGKSRQKRKYSRKDFKSVVCSTCNSCESIDVNPTFCYDFVYLLGNKKQRRKLVESIIKAANFNLHFFEDVFCSPYICNEFTPYPIVYGPGSPTQCKNVNRCSAILKAQMTGTSDVIVKWGPTKRKKRKTRYVAEPYVTLIISNNNTEWAEKVDSILYGNNNREQNNDKECAKNDTG